MAYDEVSLWLRSQRKEASIGISENSARKSTMAGGQRRLDLVNKRIIRRMISIIISTHSIYENDFPPAMPAVFDTNSIGY